MYIYTYKTENFCTEEVKKLLSIKFNFNSVMYFLYTILFECYF